MPNTTEFFLFMFSITGLDTMKRLRVGQEPGQHGRGVVAFTLIVQILGSLIPRF
jgi:hypothetical protein